MEGAVIMGHEVSGSPRASLGFVEEAKKAFAFLIAEFGFHVAPSEVTIVRYRSTEVFVNIYHGRMSYELRLEIGRLDEPSEVKNPFYMSDLISVEDEEGGRRYRAYQTNQVELVPRGLALMAADLRRYSSRALRGDPLYYAQLQAARERAARRFGREITVSQTRQQAETAWQEKDYSKVASLYDEISGYLSPAERKRRDYARRKR
jgi:hypothetical protein